MGGYNPNAYGPYKYKINPNYNVESSAATREPRAGPSAEARGPRALERLRLYSCLGFGAVKSGKRGLLHTNFSSFDYD